MMILGFYIQSSITAIRLTPVSVRAIGSFEELFHAAKARAVTPCFDADWYTILFSLVDHQEQLALNTILAAGIGSTRRINRATSFSECYRGTQAGTHVALSVCTDDEIAAASQWNLVPGEHYITTIQAPAIDIMNPHR
ncbi:hypothetical protein MTO96_031465 [Rhipicephalus appendiculatus]